MQPEREREVAEVVGGELHFLAARRQCQLWIGHHAGVVDQDVQRSAPMPATKARDAATGRRGRVAPTMTASLPVLSLMSAATRSPAAVLRTASVTAAPAAASARAVSTPIPELRR